jgi:hypothetical protein
MSKRENIGDVAGSPEVLVFRAALPGLATATGWSQAENTQNGDDAPSVRSVLLPALLFEAGEYPDKGVSVSESDLRELAARFDHAQTGGRVFPVKAEHTDTPLDPLGEVMALFVRQGSDATSGRLYGVLAFSPGIATHLNERGARHLSVAFLRRSDGEGGGFDLKEVSVVQTPRVKEAGFLPMEHDGAFATHAIQSESHVHTEWIARTLTRLRAAGKVTPAMEEPLTRLLSWHARDLADLGFSANNHGQANAPSPVAVLAVALLESAPVVQARLPALPAPLVFAHGEADAIAPTETVRRIAEGLGLDAVRVSRELTGTYRP